VQPQSNELEGVSSVLRRLDGLYRMTCMSLLGRRLLFIRPCGYASCDEEVMGEVVGFNAISCFMSVRDEEGQTHDVYPEQVRHVFGTACKS
jgi:hypothetical protein